MGFRHGYCRHLHGPFAKMNVLRPGLLANFRIINAMKPATVAVARSLPFSRRHASTSSTPVSWKDPEVDPQLNGYPQLPAISHQHRPANGWDDPQERRNFGEPVSSVTD